MKKIWIYIFTQPLCHRQNMTQSQFLTGVKLVWIQSFPSPILVAKPRLKIPYSQGGEQIDSCLSQGHQHKVKWKKPHPGFKSRSPILFPLTITITSSMSHYALLCKSSPSNFVSASVDCQFHQFIIWTLKAFGNKFFWLISYLVISTSISHF